MCDTTGNLFARKDDRLQLELLAMFGPNPVPGTPARCLGQTLAVGSSAQALVDPKTHVFLDPKPSVQSED